MSKLVDDHATKNDSDERQPSAGTRDTHGQRLRKPYKAEQKEKSNVNPDIDAEQASCRK